MDTQVTHPRCYIEFCCNEATQDVTDYGHERPGGYSGRWGYCNQHARRGGVIAGPDGRELRPDQTNNL